MCETIDAYFPAIEKMIDLYGYDSILLATDDYHYEEIIQQLKDRFNNMEILSYNGNGRLEVSSFHGKSIEFAENLNQTSVHLLSMMYMVELYIISSHAKGFVGKFTSNFFRLAVAWNSFQCDYASCFSPFISIDSTFCFGHGRYTGFSLVRNENFLC